MDSILFLRYDILLLKTLIEHDWFANSNRATWQSNSQNPTSTKRQIPDYQNMTFLNLKGKQALPEETVTNYHRFKL